MWFYLLKQYGARRLLSEFPNKGWKLESIDSLLKTIRKTGTLSGNQAAVAHASRITLEDLVLSEEDKPNKHRSPIIHLDLQLSCFKRRRAQLLSEANRISRLTRW